MGKQGAMFILGFIATICILVWLFAPGDNTEALIFGSLILIGLFIYLFFGKDRSINT